jgi:hypothetical protein
LAALIAAALPAPAAARAYPPLGLYGSILGNGYPYLKSNGALDTLEIGRASRFAEVVLDVNPISPYRPDIAAAFRARNPSIKLLGYMLADVIWNVADPDSFNQIPTVIRRTVRDLDGFLYDKNTHLEYPMLNINMAKKGANGHFVVAEALAAIVRDRIIATGTWDGLFADIYCHGAGWLQGGTTNVIDYQKAGYATLADLDLAWAAASDTFASRVRLYGGPNFIFVGNCGASTEHAWCNGWMRETFPYQQGGTWTSNMLGDAASRGYFRDDKEYRQLPHNWIFTAPATGYTPYHDFNNQRVRYGLASAALGEGVHTIGPSSRRVQDGPYQDWWYDEYAVDITTGRSSPMVQHTGWLGAPKGPAFTQVWAGTTPDAITNTNFETDVTSGWTFHVFTPAAATLSRDPLTAGFGSSSMKVHITASYPVDYYVYLNSVGQLPLIAGSSYSATFRCKASTPRNIHVMAGNSGGQAFISVDNVWRNYQAVMVPGASVTASLAFFIGNQTGDVWFDDVHFQQGASSVWRRDFQNGVVLVNPSDRALSVPLEMAYRRLLGEHTTNVNNGLSAQLQYIPAYDAIFLLRPQLDEERPAPVNDLRTSP